MSRISREEPTRTERVPVASNRAPLIYKGLDQKNFHQRWVLDRDDRLANFLQAGYVFKTKDDKNHGEETKVDTSSGLDSRVTKSAGFGGLKLYLMELPIAFYTEDQKAKQMEVNELEKTMRRPGAGKAVSSDVDFGSISMDRGKMPA